MKKKKILIPVILLIILVAVIVAVILALNTQDDEDEETVYRETTVEYGELTVGVTESGSVTVGTTEQTFDLDMSAYSGGGSGFSWDNLLQGMMGGGSSSSSSRELTVEEVFITEGQEISEGDILYTISAESVSTIRTELLADVSDAEVSLEQYQTQQTLTELEATQTLNTNTLYGQLANTEYADSVDELQEAVLDIQDQMEDLTLEIAELQLDLAEYQENLALEETALENGEYVLANTDILEDPYGWITAENAREVAEETVEELEDSIESTEESIEEKLEELAELEESLTGAERDLELGVIQAQATLDLRTLRLENADEIYAVSVELSVFNTETAQSEYEEAVEKLAEFDTYLGDYSIVSDYNGVVTTVSLEEGDAINTGSVVVILNDYDDVTVVLSIEESEVSHINEGDSVNVSIAAYPDEEFTGIVEEIGDSTYNSSTGVTYVEITVLLGGNTAELYEGMTAEITFITEETDTVLYVSNRAITRENGKSYVKKMEEDGTVVTQEVETGFSDGTYVEIIEGLSEGDTVLIESKVGD